MKTRLWRGISGQAAAVEAANQVPEATNKGKEIAEWLDDLLVVVVLRQRRLLSGIQVQCRQQHLDLKTSFIS